MELIPNPEPPPVARSIVASLLSCRPWFSPMLSLLRHQRYVGCSPRSPTVSKHFVVVRKRGSGPLSSECLTNAQPNEQGAHRIITQLR